MVASGRSFGPVEQPRKGAVLALPGTGATWEVYLGKCPSLAMQKVYIHVLSGCLRSMHKCNKHAAPVFQFEISKMCLHGPWVYVVSAPSIAILALASLCLAGPPVHLPSPMAKDELCMLVHRFSAIVLVPNMCVNDLKVDNSILLCMDQSRTSSGLIRD